MVDSIFVTGGCGFIGSHFIRYWLKHIGTPVVNLDLLTYAGNHHFLHEVEGEPSHHFVQGDINDYDLVSKLLHQHQPMAVLNFAAESHVDRSILQAEKFIQTNIVGTFRLLEAVRAYWEGLPKGKKQDFRYIQISTDEVYGSLQPEAPPFIESSPYAPNSPYAASKASGDHLARAWHVSYDLPVITTHSSNNYGPWQFPEKLIPYMIQAALQNKSLPLYGDGQQRRDWLHVSDHCAAIYQALKHGQVGESYGIGAEEEHSNQHIVEIICQHLDQIYPRSDKKSYGELISHVADRPGHDRRYALDCRKLKTEFGWTPDTPFSDGLKHTIEWYLSNQAWVQSIHDEAVSRDILIEYNTRSLRA